jgi:stress response protein YsnF
LNARAYSNKHKLSLFCTRALLGDAADLLRERTVELQETAEEAVVAKEAIVNEELHIRKRADERVEQIDDTVRRTEVEVDDSRSSNQAGADASRKSSPAEVTRRTP